MTIESALTKLRANLHRLNFVAVLLGVNKRIIADALIDGTGYAEVRAVGWPILIRFTPDFPNARKLLRTEKTVDLYVYVLHA